MNNLNHKSFLTSLMLLSSVTFASPASVEHVSIEIEKVRNEIRTSLNQLTANLNFLISKLSNADSTISKQIETLENEIKELPIVRHQIGEIFQGGMVFYVDSTQQHGLAVSLVDLGEEVEWRNGEGGDRITNAKALGIGAGETNTRLIISEQTVDAQEGNFAALLTHNYQTKFDGSKCSASFNASSLCYGGWYLPSVFELVLLHQNLKTQGLANIKNESYWSSSEFDTTQARVVDLGTGEPKIQDKSMKFLVRAVRNF